LATADIADAGVDALRAGPIDHQVADQAQTVIRESDTPRA
jgi:hypothetical protein